MELGVKSEKHTETDMNGKIFKAEETEITNCPKDSFSRYGFLNKYDITVPSALRLTVYRSFSQIDQSDIAVT